MSERVTMRGVKLHQGDCRDVLKGMADNSIDSCVCDPPYALVSIVKRFGKAGSAKAKKGKTGAYERASRGFMGKTWDNEDTAFATDFWGEVYRVLKPGGHVLAFGGTRTYHRLACAIEDAGFEIRDQIGWAYGSGFPKSHNQHGDWEGWGTALKPAWEPIVVARKPLDGTNAANLEKWGVGALNIDGCRIEGEFTSGWSSAPGKKSKGGILNITNETREAKPDSANGRWPANIIHDGSDEVLAAFPSAPGQMAASIEDGEDQGNTVYGAMKRGGPHHTPRIEIDKSASRFFYCAKASRADRDGGLEHMESVSISRYGEQGQGSTPQQTPRRAVPQKNTHPTVKPTELMRYLCRLVTPPDGVVLDPFMGSGSTGKAAVLEGFQFIGIEREDEYMPIAAARIAWAVGQMDRPDAPVKPKRKPPANDNLSYDLFSAGAA